MTLKAYEEKEYACLVVLYEGYIEIELNHPFLLGWSMNISCIYCMTRRLISSHAWDGGSPVGITLSITSVISFANLTIYTGMFGIFVWLALRIEMQ